MIAMSWVQLPVRWLLLGWVTVCGQVNQHQGQLSLPSLRGRQIEYRPAWLGLRRDAFTCVGWQVTLCEPIWQVTLRSTEMWRYHNELFRWRRSSVHSLRTRLILKMQFESFMCKVLMEHMYCVHVHRLIAGYYSSRLYKTMRGQQWKRAAFLVSHLV